MRKTLTNRKDRHHEAVHAFQYQISALIADGVGKALSAQGASPQPASPHFLPKGSKMPVADLASKDAKIVAAFARKG